MHARGRRSGAVHVVSQQSKFSVRRRMFVPKKKIKEVFYLPLRPLVRFEAETDQPARNRIALPRLQLYRLDRDVVQRGPHD